MLVSLANSVSLINKRFVDHLTGNNILSGKYYGFRSATSTAEVPSVIKQRIDKVFNDCCIVEVSDLDIWKDFERFAAQTLTPSFLDELSPLSTPLQEVVPWGSFFNVYPSKVHETKNMASTFVRILFLFYIIYLPRNILTYIYKYLFINIYTGVIRVYECTPYNQDNQSRRPDL